MSDKSLNADELTRIEKKIAEKLPRIEMNKQHVFKINVVKLRKLAAKIQRFEEDSGVAPIRQT